MKKVAIQRPGLVLSTVLFATSLGSVAACASEAPDERNRKDNEVRGQSRSDAGASKENDANLPVGPKPSAPSGDAGPTSGTTQCSAVVNEADGCERCCVDRTPGAGALVTSDEACLARCREDDEACFARCSDAVDATCAGNPGMCASLKACLSTCPVVDEP